jgi:hypothetical protein
MRDNITAMTFTGTPTRMRASPVQRAQHRTRATASGGVSPAAVAVALKIAGGDPGRLVFLPDGSVLVGNKPRPRTNRHLRGQTR